MLTPMNQCWITKSWPSLIATSTLPSPLNFKLISRYHKLRMSPENQLGPTSSEKHRYDEVRSKIAEPLGRGNIQFSLLLQATIFKSLYNGWKDYRHFSSGLTKSEVSAGLRKMERDAIETRKRRK